MKNDCGYLLITCKNNEQCKHIKQTTFDQHLTECQYQEINCTQCNTKVIRKDLKVHLSSVCKPIINNKRSYDNFNNTSTTTTNTNNIVNSSNSNKNNSNFDEIIQSFKLEKEEYDRELKKSKIEQNKLVENNEVMLASLNKSNKKLADAEDKIIELKSKYSLLEEKLNSVLSKVSEQSIATTETTATTTHDINSNNKLILLEERLSYVLGRVESINTSFTTRSGTILIRGWDKILSNYNFQNGGHIKQDINIGSDKFEWQVYPIGFNNESNGFVSIFLSKLTVDSKRVDFSLKLTINHTGKDNRRYSKKFKSLSFNKKNSSDMGDSHFIHFNEISYLKNLIIEYKIELRKSTEIEYIMCNGQK